jgi:hypothetical protein
MRKTSITALLATLMLSAGSALAADPPKYIPRLEAGPPAVAGGFAQAKADSPELRAARSVAVEEFLKRRGPKSGPNVIREEVQVVAGLNFRFLIKAANGPMYEVVVFRPLTGPMSVIRFEQRR